MIIEYHRPETIEAALQLLARSEPPTYPLGGGSYLSRHSPTDCAVVDLQNLQLNQITPVHQGISIGACATLQQVLDSPEIPDAIKEAIRFDSTFNQRQIATLGGTIVCSDGRSNLAALLVACEARLTWMPGDKKMALADWLPLREKEKLGALITEVFIPMQCDLKLDKVSRTPADRPIVNVAAAIYASGRTRIVVGGFGKSPSLAFDGPDSSGAEIAVATACSEANDQWASAEYRQDVARVMTRRLLAM